MIEKVQLELSLLLPDVAEEGDTCVQRLREQIEAKTGVDATHLVERPAGGPPRLCVHVDPAQYTVQELRRFAYRAGTELQAKYGHIVVDIASMPAGRARRLNNRLSERPGILESAVSPAGTVRIEFDREQTDEATLHSTLNDLVGLVAQPEKAGHAHGVVFGQKTELVFVGLCGITLLIGWLMQTFSDAPSWVAQTLLVAAYFFGGWFTFREAIEHLRTGRFEIDTLMLAAAIGAAVLGEWAEGALLLFLFSLGHALEAYAMGRAKRAIEALADLTPATANIIREGQVSEVPVDALAIGDIVLVRPNERLPADGFVIKGESSINQAPITGESMPVDKYAVVDIDQAASNAEATDASSRVFAGSVNGSGALQIYVTRLSGESTLARVVSMVREAETNQSPTQQFTDRFERIFTPAVLISAVLVLLFGFVFDAEMSASFYRMFAFLVAASPCALAIATPSAVLSGIARAARGGVLIKGGGPLENLGRLRAIAFDKTGTLTEGKPRLVDIVPYLGADKLELMRVAIAVESLSDHPLAAAVVRVREELLHTTPIPQASGLRSLTGRGVQAQVEGLDTYIGKDDLFTEIDGPALPDDLQTRVDELEASGRTTMIVRHGDRYLGVIGLMDTPRAAAAGVITQLRTLGIRRMLMISGDNQNVADAVAREVGLDEARGDLMPDDKVTTIKQLRKEAAVAMVGDGVNDAPAMANATVGIAMGAAGSDVALETADVALMSDDLRHLPFAVGLSRASSRVIRQNLWFSLGMVAILVPSTLFGLSIGAAVLMHEGSTVLVVFNALRLLAYQSPAMPGGVDLPQPDHEAREHTSLT
jgi:Zn2+/Cd2+-exporting ATPase